MTLKDHLLATGTACVLVMSIAIAQNQAPAPQPQPIRPLPRAAQADNREELLNQLPEDQRDRVRQRLNQLEQAVAQPDGGAAAGQALPPGGAAQPAAALADDDDLPNPPEEGVLPPAVEPPPRQPPAALPRAGVGGTTRAGGITAPGRTGVGTGTPRALGQTGAGGVGSALTPAAGAGNLLGGGAALGSGTGLTARANSPAKTNALKFTEAQLEIVLGAYTSLTKKVPIVEDDVPKATFTFKCPDEVDLTPEDSIWVLEQILSIKGIGIEPYTYDDKFIRVFARKTGRTTGIPFLKDRPGTPSGLHPEDGKTIGQMITLQNITAKEAETALKGFQRPDGLFQIFERINAILVTDTQENINRMLEIIDSVDIPDVPPQEEVVVRQIMYAKAADIKKALEEFVTESQRTTQKDTVEPNRAGAPGVSRTTTTTSIPARPPVPGLVNQRLPAAATPTPNETITSAMAEAERGMIKGKVHIMADERTNKLIVTTKSENMTFFDDIIKELDVATDPPVKVDVRRLEYADAEEVATKLNELIGGAAPRQGTGTTPATAPGRPGATTPGAPADSAGGGRLADVNARIEAARNAAAAAAAAADGSASSLAQLSKDNIKILSDKRTNAIIMMGSRGDLAAIQDVITKMDIRLAQVLIEVVVIQVELSNGITAGMDWVLGNAANDYTMRNGKDKGAGGGGTGMSLLGSLTGIASGASGTNEVLSAASHVLNRGINYFLHSDKLNISALIQAAKTDSHAKVLSSPVILTVDNKDASIEVTTMRYLYKGMRVGGGGGYSSYYELPDFEQKDIGLILKVTPRINPNGTVVLTVDQDFSTVGPDQDVGGDKYPTINKRLLKADVSVENMQTAVLGGLVGSESIKSEDGIPILKDIPWIGRWLFGSVKDTEIRSELLVFLTPYVFESSASLQAEAERRKLTLSDPRPWSDKGWSSGPLADPMSAKEIQDREIRKWAAEDAEYKAQREQEKLYEERVKMLQKRAEKEAAEAAKRQKKGLPPAPTRPTVRAGGDDVDVFWQEDEDDSL